MVLSTSILVRFLPKDGLFFERFRLKPHSKYRLRVDGKKKRPLWKRWSNYVEDEYLV